MGLYLYMQQTAIGPCCAHAMAKLAFVGGYKGEWDKFPALKEFKVQRRQCICINKERKEQNGNVCQKDKE